MACEDFKEEIGSVDSFKYPDEGEKQSQIEIKVGETISLSELYEVGRTQDDWFSSIEFLNDVCRNDVELPTYFYDESIKGYHRGCVELDLRIDRTDFNKALVIGMTAYLTYDEYGN